MRNNCAPIIITPFCVFRAIFLRRSVLQTMTIKRIKKKHVGWIAGLAVCSLVFVSMGFDGFLNSFSQWPPRSQDIRVCGIGAWGRLWYEPSSIEIPPDRIQFQNFTVKKTQWYVAGGSSAGLMESLQSCGLTPEQIRDLASTMSPAPDGTGRILTPPGEWIVSLSDPIRRKLYGMLAKYAPNDMCAWPFRFSGDSPDDWLKKGTMDPEVMDLVKSLIYHEGKSQMFSDLNFVLECYPSVGVYSNLFTVLSRQSTLVARVRVLPEDDVDTLARYWGVPHREAEVRTLMKTLQGTDDCRDVPVSMLLPGFARDRIYRYWHEGDPEFASCHYTAMNFLNERADGQFTNLTHVAQVLANDYVEVKQDFKLGDVILLMKNASEAIHSCNYVAGGIVFTHNGGSFAQPWMLTTLDAVVDFYSYPDAVQVKVMRRRDLMDTTPDNVQLSFRPPPPQ